MRDETKIGGPGGAFPATRWSVIERARSEDPGRRREALEALFAVYWKPIYKCLRLRWGRSNEDAKDLTQEFFVRLIDRDVLAGFNPERARLRTFLRTCLDRFVQNHDRDAQRLKRGGALEHLPMDFVAAEAELASSTVPVEELFDREWVRALVGLAVEELETDCRERDRSLDFTLFERYDLCEDADERPTYGRLADEHGVEATTVTNRLASVRRRFRRIVLSRLRELTASEEEFRAEARAVLGVTLE